MVAWPTPPAQWPEPPRQCFRPREHGSCGVDQAGSLLAPACRSITIALVVLITLVAFEALAVATAMPVAARELDGVRWYGLAFSLFLTTALLGIVMGGLWCDRVGPRAPLLTALVLFTGGLLLSGAAPSFELMLIGRAVSGAGGGLEVVALYVLIAAVYPPAVQPRIFAAVSAAWVLPSLIGPPIAGFLATQVSWRAVFLVAPPLALLPPLALWRWLGPGTPAPGPGPGRGYVVGRLLRGLGLALGTALLQLGLQGTGPGPTGLVVAVALVLVLASLPGLLPPGTLLLARGLPSLVVVRLLLTAAYYGAETFVPLMLVANRGLTPALAGLTLTVGAVGWSVGSWVQGRQSLGWSRITLLQVSGLVVGGSTVLLIPNALGGLPAWLVALEWAVGGFGMGLGMASTSVLTLRLSEPGEEGRNSASLQVGDSLGGVLGIGAAGAVFAALHSPGDTDAAAYGVIWGGLGVVGVLSGLAALRVRTARTAAEL